MASQVLSGSGNMSYTNNTGQNVRIVINAVTVAISGGARIDMSAGGSSFYGNRVYGFGKNIAYYYGTASSNNMSAEGGDIGALPTEVMLSPGQSFSLAAVVSQTGGVASMSYNIVVIPEAG